jgi:hypothetical protein
VYADANNKALPQRLEDLWPGYLKDPAVFQCPMLRNPKQSAPPVHCDYFYLPECAGSNAGAVAFSPKEPKSGGRNVLVSGGSVEFVTDEEAFRASVLTHLKAAGVSLQPAPDASLKERERFERLRAELFPDSEK